MRPIVSAAVLGLLLALAVATAAGAAARPRAATPRVSPSEQAILAEVNRVRAAHALPALRQDGRLARAAESHTLGMLRTKRFAHDDVAARLKRFGVHGGTVGENLAWGAGTYASAQAIVRMWLGSPSHRANLLRPGFRRIGLGAAVGSFEGYAGAVVVTADFQGT
jgi:uncharacterized protein YkwD